MFKPRLAAIFGWNGMSACVEQLNSVSGVLFTHPDKITSPRLAAFPQGLRRIGVFVPVSERFSTRIWLLKARNEVGLHQRGCASHSRK